MEHVILVDSSDREIGTVPKYEAHLGDGLLHRALSVFVFNDDRDLLLQRRAKTKYHFAGLWSNTCCTHPRPGEPVSQAAKRRLVEEMGVSCDLELSFVFQYEARCESGLIEQEVDHVFLGAYDGPVRADPEEVCDTRWIGQGDLDAEMTRRPEIFTPWFRMALPRVLEALPSEGTDFSRRPFRFEAQPEPGSGATKPNRQPANR